MKLFSLCKDGGPESTVWGYFLCEIKSLFSIVLLRFENGSRDAYHSHAFNCVSWVLKGQLEEQTPPSDLAKLSGWPYEAKRHLPSLMPVFTYRDTTHKVVSIGRTWVISFRGPWAKIWKEIEGGEEKTLTSGRRVVE